jgi:hypothetical protein
MANPGAEDVGVAKLWDCAWFRAPVFWCFWIKLSPSFRTENLILEGRCETHSPFQKRLNRYNGGGMEKEEEEGEGRMGRTEEVVKEKRTTGGGPRLFVRGRRASENSAAQKKKVGTHG